MVQGSKKGPLFLGEINVPYTIMVFKKKIGQLCLYPKSQFSGLII
jgi:hypothetical protein